MKFRIIVNGAFQVQGKIHLKDIEIYFELSKPIFSGDGSWSFSECVVNENSSSDTDDKVFDIELDLNEDEIYSTFILKDFGKEYYPDMRIFTYKLPTQEYIDKYEPDNYMSDYKEGDWVSDLDNRDDVSKVEDYKTDDIINKFCFEILKYCKENYNESSKEDL